LVGEYFLQGGAVVGVGSEVEAKAGNGIWLVGCRMPYEINDLYRGFAYGDVTGDAVKGVMQFPALPWCGAGGGVGDGARLTSEFFPYDCGADGAEGQCLKRDSIA
jgi:hypothetical protein